MGTHNSRTMMTKPPGDAVSTTPTKRPASGVPQPSVDSPAAALAKIRELVSDGDVREAQRLAEDAAKRFPDDVEVTSAHRVLNSGRSYTKPGTGHNSRQEFEWLQDPPERYRGKWVALIGRRVVGAANTLKELLDGLPSDLEQPPLTVQVAP